MDIVQILDDPRPIKAIEMQGTNDGDGDYYTAKFGVTIVAYGEPGLYCNLPWFVVIEDDEVVKRLNAHAVGTVEYE